MGTMNPRPDNPGLPRFDSSTADSPFAPRTPNSYMGSKIVITALIILVVIIFFFTAYRVYVHVVWRRHRRPIVGGTSRRHNQDDSSQGLDKAIVDSLPTFTYMTRVPLHGAANIETGATECAVCLVEFQDNDACRLLPKCNHSFHTECIDKWFLSHTTCPMCRTAAEMVVDAEDIRQAENVRACLLPHAEDGNEQMQRLDSSLSQQELSNGTHRLRSKSSACIPIDEDTANEIQISRTRSISLFSGEHEERLGRHMHQILSRTFSSRRANGRYDMVQQEAHNDMHSIDVMKEITPGNGYIAEGDVQRNHPLIRSHASEILVQHANLPHWQRSASDRYLNLRQGSQYPTNVLFWGNDSHVLSFPCAEHWRVGGRSLSHSKSNIEVPRSQDSFFRLGHSPLGSPLRCIATGEAHQPSSPAAISQQQAK